MKIFCETKHLSTLAEELWRTASTRFLVKTITIWSQLLWYWPNLYERSVILINAQFILSPHLLFRVFDKIYLSGNVSVLLFTFCFPLAPFTGTVISPLVAIWSPACFYYGLGIGIFVIGSINHCNRWELTNKNLLTLSFLSTFATFRLSEKLVKNSNKCVFLFPFLVYKLVFIVLYVTGEVI